MHIDLLYIYLFYIIKKPWLSGPWSYKDTPNPTFLQNLKESSSSLSLTHTHPPYVGEQASSDDREVVGAVGLRRACDGASRHRRRESPESVGHEFEDAVAEGIEKLRPRRRWSRDCGGFRKIRRSRRKGEGDFAQIRRVRVGCDPVGADSGSGHQEPGIWGSGSESEE